MSETSLEESFHVVMEWDKCLSNVITAHHAFKHEPHSSEKLDIYKATWNKAIDMAGSTDDLSELGRHIPFDHIDDHHSNAEGLIDSKWTKLFNEELPEVADDPYRLLHLYAGAPLSHHKERALDALVTAINKEGDALHFYDIARSGKKLAFALEKKFPDLFSEEIEARKNGTLPEEEPEEVKKEDEEEDDDDDSTDDEPDAVGRFMDTVSGL
jgi:hypothetical protein